MSIKTRGNKPKNFKMASLFIIGENKYQDVFIFNI